MAAAAPVSWSKRHGLTLLAIFLNRPFMMQKKRCYDRLIICKSDSNLIKTSSSPRDYSSKPSTHAPHLRWQWCLRCTFWESFSKDWIHTSLRLCKWAQMKFLSLYWQSKVLVKSCIHCAPCKYLQSRIKPDLPQIIWNISKKESRKYTGRDVPKLRSIQLFYQCIYGM